MARYFAILVATTAIAAAVAYLPVRAADVRPVVGPIVLAHAGTQEEYLWDASVYVAQLVADDLLGSAGTQAIEASAMVALAQKAQSSTAKTVSIAVYYAPPSATSIYGRGTFSQEEKLFVMTAPRANAAKDGKSWAQQIANGQVPPEVRVETTGALPPAQ